jgi:hypothetical protein
MACCRLHSRPCCFFFLLLPPFSAGHNYFSCFFSPGPSLNNARFSRIQSLRSMSRSYKKIINKKIAFEKSITHYYHKNKKHIIGETRRKIHKSHKQTTENIPIRGTIHFNHNLFGDTSNIGQ